MTGEERGESTTRYRHQVQTQGTTEGKKKGVGSGPSKARRSDQGRHDDGYCKRIKLEQGHGGAVEQGHNRGDMQYRGAAEMAQSRRGGNKRLRSEGGDGAHSRGGPCQGSQEWNKKRRIHAGARPPDRREHGGAP